MMVVGAAGRTAPALDDSSSMPMRCCRRKALGRHGAQTTFTSHAGKRINSTRSPRRTLRCQAARGSSSHQATQRRHTRNSKSTSTPSSAVHVQQHIDPVLLYVYAKLTVAGSSPAGTRRRTRQEARATTMAMSMPVTMGAAHPHARAVIRHRREASQDAIEIAVKHKTTTPPKPTSDHQRAMYERRRWWQLPSLFH
ncbi:hypothetical protein EJB05_57746, partial [Eragrostis curvula]